MITVRALTPTGPVRCAAPRSSHPPHPGGRPCGCRCPCWSPRWSLPWPRRRPSPRQRPSNATWSPPLTAGSGVGVAVRGGAAQIDQRTAFRAPLEEGGAEGTPDTAVPTGLLTLDTHRLASPTNRVGATVAARVTEGATAAVDVRGLRANGNWSEWIPADDGAAVLPEPVPRHPGPARADRRPRPGRDGLTLHALSSVRVEGAGAEAAPLRYQVFATREGLLGGTTANGHVIAPHDHFVALPSRRALSPNGRSDYSVRICAPNGRCAFAPVWDVGPWNTKDDYWNPAQPRTVGRPQAGHAGGTGRVQQRLQRRQGRVRPQGGQPGGHRPRRRHLLGRPGPDQQHHGHRRLPVDGHHAADRRRRRPRVRLAAPSDRMWWAGSGTARACPVECATDGWVRIGEASTSRRRRCPTSTTSRPARRARGRRRIPPRQFLFLRGHTGAMDPGRASAHVADGRVPGPRGHGRGDRQRHDRAGRAVLALVVAVALVIGVNFANDYSDGIRGTDDDRVGPAPPGRRRAAAAPDRPRRRLRLLRGGRVGRAALVLAVAKQWWLIAVGAAVHRRAPGSTPGARPYGYAGLGRAGRVRLLRAGRGARHHARAEPAAASPSRWFAARRGRARSTCAVLVANNLRDIPTRRDRGQAHAGRSASATATPGRLYTALVRCRSCCSALAGLRSWPLLLGLLAAARGGDARPEGAGRGRRAGADPGAGRDRGATAELVGAHRDRPGARHARLERSTDSGSGEVVAAQPRPQHLALRRPPHPAPPS